jgi:EmrB/QacA subfamily drug resistance transporter
MRKWWPLVTISLGSFMLLVDVTIVNVALPAMVKDLGTSFSSLQWVVDGYALSLAALLLGVGSIADIIGHRRTYVGGLVLFALSSLACGLAPNAEVLIAARVVQGVGAAAMFATTFALLNSSYQGRDRGTAYGIWGAIIGASAAIGPILGGLLTQGLSWRWIFFVNLPVSVIAIVMALRVLSGDRPTSGQRVDLPGMGSFTVAAAALTFAMIRATEDGWGSSTVLGFLLLGVLALVAFVLIETHSDHPMLDLALLTRRSFVGVILAALVLSFAAFANLTYTSIWLQSLLGLSPIEAGLTGLPLSAAAFLVSAVIGRFLHKSSPGPIIGGGLVLIGAGAMISAALLHSGSSWPALMVGYTVVGLGVGLATPTLASAGMAAVAPERGGMAAGAVNTARQLGYAFGIAVLGSVFTVRAATSLREHGVPDSSHAANALAGGQAHEILGAAGGQASGRLVEAVHSAFASGLDAVLLVSGLAGIVTGLAVFVLCRGPRDGQTATGAMPAGQPAGAVTPAS